MRPTATATFTADHAYGTADDAIACVERLRDAGAGAEALRGVAEAIASTVKGRKNSGEGGGAAG
ncbi:hypothetical protein [Streptomyces sp. G44]|uniref:hypothetical protein n=1 Tax=Streptomyces sp. G44 TaxID=2807632 RepID=UPI0027DB67DE|nr:hypothetical protein [Streptomyces sp. G44]